MMPTILLLASPMGLAIITAGAAVAATALLLQENVVPVRRDEGERRRGDGR